MAKITNEIIHCSDSEFGSAADIRRWHLNNGWDDIGYHFVIMNGLICPDTSWQKKLYIPSLDGAIEVGRRLDGDSLIAGNEIGAHTLGYNENSIGICLIGVKTFTAKQFYSLARLINELDPIYHVALTKILGHYQVSKNRTCPNFHVPRFLADMAWILSNSPAVIDPLKYRQSA